MLSRGVVSFSPEFDTLGVSVPSSDSSELDEAEFPG